MRLRARPGLDHDVDRRPWRVARTASGTSATRRSPLGRSFGTETFISGGRGRGMPAERARNAASSGAPEARPPAARGTRRARPGAAVRLAASAGAAPRAAPAPGRRAPRPRVAACALGTSAADLRGFQARRPWPRPSAASGQGRRARAYSRRRGGLRVRARAAERQQHRAALPREPDREHRRAGRARRAHRGLPNVDTTYTVGQIDLVGRPAAWWTCPTPPGATTCSSSWTPTRTRSPTSAGAPPARRPARYALVPPGYSGALPAGAKRIQSPTNLIWLIGRTLVQGAADLPAGHRADARVPAHRRSPPGRPASARARSCSAASRPCRPARAAEGPRLLRRAGRDAGREPAAEARRLRAARVPRGRRRRRA